MNVKEYLQSLNEMPDAVNSKGESIKDAIMQSVSIWSNSACIGYCIHAMENSGINKAAQRKILNELYHSFDELTVGEAECFGK